MVNSSFPFYKDNIPYGHPFGVGDVWNSGTKPTITFTPVTGYVGFVKYIKFHATLTFDITAGAMIIKHSLGDGSNEYFYASIGSGEELLVKACDITAYAWPTGQNKIGGVLELPAPVKCFSSAGHTFTISDSSSTVAGEINLEICGWQWLESEYNEAT
jgi:hypothetical protein